MITVSVSPFPDTLHKVQTSFEMLSDNSVHHIDLSRSTHIREIGFKCTRLSDVHHILNRLPCPDALRTLSYTMGMRDLDPLKDAEMRRLDSYLSRHCTSLKRFTLRCHHSDDGSLEKKLRSLLSTSSASGILNLMILGDVNTIKTCGKPALASCSKLYSIRMVRRTRSQVTRVCTCLSLRIPKHALPLRLYIHDKCSDVYLPRGFTVHGVGNRVFDSTAGGI